MSIRRARSLDAALAAWALCVAGCESNGAPLLIEYPIEDGGVTEEDAASEVQGQGDAPEGGAMDAPDQDNPQYPVALSDGACFIEGVTTDLHLVFSRELDLMVWPEGASSAVLAVKDFDSSTDMRRVRGRFLGVWTGADVTSLTLSVWSKAGGLEEIAPKAIGQALYARPAANEYAYLVRGADVLHADVYATQAGQGKGTRVVAQLDTGVVEQACSPWIAYSNDDLLVAGCPQDSSVPRVAGFAFDGSGQTRVLLDNSAPGMWLDHARARVLVQTASSSSLRSLTDATAPLDLGGPVLQARFSEDDARVVYLGANGVARRAQTKSPASEVVLGAASSVMGMSGDGRFVVLAKQAQTSDGRSDLILVDSDATPAASATLAPSEAVLLGIAADGGQVVYRLRPSYPVFGADELYIASTPLGVSTRISDRADGVVFDGAVVYWLEFDQAQKASTLKASRLSDPAVVLELGGGFDALTTHLRVAGKHLYVANKLGLWDYGALSP